MAKNTHQKTQLKPFVNELEAQQQLARIVSEVVKELENGATQAMLDVCRQEKRVDKARAAGGPPFPLFFNSPLPWVSKISS
jgi:hypothetical protein